MFIIRLQESAYFHHLPPLCLKTLFFSDMTFFHQTPSLFSITPEYHLSDISFLAKSMLCIIRSMTMFLKVLNKVSNFRALFTNLNYFVSLLALVRKILGVITINQSLSERGITFFLPCSACFITCMGAHFPAVALDNAIRFSTFPGCQGSCGIVPNGPAGSVVSFNISQDLKC